MKDDLISRQAAIDAVRHSPIIEVQPAYMLANADGKAVLS